MDKEEYLNSDFVKMIHLNNQVVLLTQRNEKLQKKNEQLKQQNECLKKQIKNLECRLRGFYQ